MKPQNRAASGISCMEKGLFQKSLLQKRFLTQNRAQKGKRAIRPRPAQCHFQGGGVSSENHLVRQHIKWAEKPAFGVH